MLRAEFASTRIPSSSVRDVELSGNFCWDEGSEPTLGLLSHIFIYINVWLYIYTTLYDSLQSFEVIATAKYLKFSQKCFVLFILLNCEKYRLYASSTWFDFNLLCKYNREWLVVVTVKYWIRHARCCGTRLYPIHSRHTMYFIYIILCQLIPY